MPRIRNCNTTAKGFVVSDVMRLKQHQPAGDARQAAGGVAVEALQMVSARCTTYADGV